MRLRWRVASRRIWLDNAVGAHALSSPGRALDGILRAAAATDADWGSRTAMTCRGSPPHPHRGT